MWSTADGGIEVRDYKTGSDQDELAMATYAVLAAAAYPERRPVRVAIEDLSAGRLVVREYGEAQLAQALDRIRAAARDIAHASTYPAVPSPLCASCSYNDSCPDAEGA